MEDPPAGRFLTFVVIGAVAGVLNGLFGVGGGVVMVPAMVIAVAFQQRRAHATSLAAIGPIAMVGAVAFIGAQSVDVAAALVLVIASVAGVQLGTRLMGRLPERRLSQLFGLFLIGTAVILLVR